MAFIKEKGHDQSARLAEERGPFPHFRRSIYRHGRPLRNCHRHHHRAHRHHLDDRGLLVRDRAGVRAGLRASGQGAATASACCTFVSDDLRAARPGARASTPRALMAEVARHGSMQHVAGVHAAAKAVFKTAHEIDASGTCGTRPPSRSTPTTACRRRSTCRRARPRTTWRAPICWRGTRAASASRSSATAARAPGPQRGACGPTAPRSSVAGERGSSRGRTASPGPRTGWRRRSGPPSSPSTTTAGGEPFEVFVQVGKAGSDTMAVAEALGRLVSLVLRLPSPLSPRRRLEEVDQPALPHRRRPADRLRRREGALAARRARADARRAHRQDAREPAPRRRRRRRRRRAGSGISAASAARPRWCTRKGARSVCPAASTSAEAQC